MFVLNGCLKRAFGSTGYAILILVIAAISSLFTIPIVLDLVTSGSTCAMNVGTGYYAGIEMYSCESMYSRRASKQIQMFGSDGSRTTITSITIGCALEVKAWLLIIA